MGTETAGGKVRFRCDAQGCHEIHDCETLDPKWGFSHAQELGWKAELSYRGSISCWLLYCPAHSL
jgi:hypothetical protein